jgi:hypothetical protein
MATVSSARPTQLHILNVVLLKEGNMRRDTDLARTSLTAESLCRLAVVFKQVQMLPGGTGEGAESLCQLAVVFKQVQMLPGGTGGEEG